MQSSALVVNLKQRVAEAKDNINNEAEKMEVELCRSLIDASRHTFKVITNPGTGTVVILRCGRQLTFT